MLTTTDTDSGTRIDARCSRVAVGQRQATTPANLTENGAQPVGPSFVSKQRLGEASQRSAMEDVHQSTAARQFAAQRFRERS